MVDTVGGMMVAEEAMDEMVQAVQDTEVSRVTAELKPTAVNKATAERRAMAVRMDTMDPSVVATTTGMDDMLGRRSLDLPTGPGDRMALLPVLDRNTPATE